MAINGDNSKNMSPEEIKQIWANAINRSAEKVASELHYDKTILATIQYCTDASQGQYKIQYQNGYYTAYALDKTTMYSQGAAVYVNVPGNDMNNKKFITGVMNDDNSLRVFTSNLEGDKQYSLVTKDIVSGGTDDNNTGKFDISSYEDFAMTNPPGYIRTLYDSAAPTEGLIGVNEDELKRFFSETSSNSKDGNRKYLRFGATFRTEFLEYRKMNPGADYGIRVIVSYQTKDEKTNQVTYKDVTYELNTFNMSGNPFEFTADSPRYAYFEIDTVNYQYIHKIEEYAFNFPEKVLGDEHDSSFKDIHIKDISLYGANKVYSFEDNSYVLKIDTKETGNTLGEMTTNGVVDHITAKATFSVKGNEVDEKLQNLTFFWGKQDVSVNSISHPKYNQYLGKGWRCLNDWFAIESTSTNPDDVKDYVKTSQQMPDGTIKQIGWYSKNPAVFTSNILKGKETLIRCVVLYENVPYHTDIVLYNLNGKYVLLHSSNGTEFYSGAGSTCLSAGVFQDFKNGQNWEVRNWTLDDPTSLTPQISNIVFAWEEVDFMGTSRSIPMKEAPLLYLSDFNQWTEWSETFDNIDISDAQVANNLSGVGIDYSTCIQRYNYYNDYANNAENDTDKRNTARERAQYTINKREEQLRTVYAANNANEAGNYVLGPANVTAAYKTPNDVSTVAITNVDKYYYSADTNSNYYKYCGDPNLLYPKNNVLYNLRAFNILQNSTFRVTALEVDNNGNYEAIGTTSILINNNAGSTLEYDLQIVNGTQSFMYNEGGLSPASPSGADNPILIKPLEFKLLNKKGDIVLDSESPDEEGKPSIIDIAHPKWRFPIKKTLIKTKYVGTNNYTLEGDTGILSDARHFVYGLEEQYNVSYKDSSNIVLQITYAGQTITASTNFTFTKQGELGTNGTDKYLSIEDPVYLNYKSDILADPTFCKFEDIETHGKKEMFDPNQRHLKNGYLYATQAFTANMSPAASVHDSDAIYVNLKFAQSPLQQNNTTLTDSEGHYSVNGAYKTQLFGYWYGNGEREPIDGESLWYVDIGSNLKSSPYYTESSFVMNNRKDKSCPVKGASMNLEIPEINDTVYPMYYKPTPIENFTVKGIEGTLTRVANNIVQCKATHTALNGYKSESYGYFPIPYFYYHIDTHTQGSPMPQTIDPARYFVITGGYDQVVYDSTGLNPQYNKQAPFSFHLYDLNHNDITEKVLNDANSIVSWGVSTGFNLTQLFDIQHIPSYADIPVKESLLGKVCRYGEGDNEKVYRCKINHMKYGEKIIKVDGENISITYESGAFVDPYWEVIKDNTKAKKVNSIYLNPDPTYESAVQQNLFNAWVTVFVSYTDPETQLTYEAEALLPINMLCNKYGSEEINNWDGKKTVVDDAYIISSKVAAGVKNSDNSFTGITIGKNLYKDTGREEVGLFGYGKYRVQDRDPNTQETIGSAYQWGRTLFMDANSGLAIFGPTGSSQIVLNPSMDHIYDTNGEQDWSKLAGWYFSRDFLYKPIGEDRTPKTYGEILQSQTYAGPNTTPDDIFKPSDAIYGSVGIYAPWHVGDDDDLGRRAELDTDTVFIWASANNKDLGSKQKKEALEKKQRTLKSQWNVKFSEINLEIINHAEVVHTLDVEWNQYVKIKRALIKKLNGEAPVSRFDPQTGEEFIEGLPADIYEADVGQFNTEEEINDEIDRVTDKIADAAANKEEALHQMDDVYEAMLQDYKETIEDESQGNVTTYKNFNDKKSNFYVTYGGFLHASSAEIEGNIKARSGEFGSGSDKIQIAHMIDGQNYIFYNENFWVKDSSNLKSDLDQTVYMKGRIMANSGQFGEVNNNKNGDDQDIVSIQYSWYPYYYPKPADWWGKGPDGRDGTPHADKTQGRNTKYIFYHPNFHIKSDGTTFMKGTVYASGGRIGNFNMNTKQIWDCCDTIRLKPGLDNSDRGYIQAGRIFFMDNGNIYCFTEFGVPRPAPNPDQTIESAIPPSAGQVESAWATVSNRAWGIDCTGHLVQYYTDGQGINNEQYSDTTDSPRYSRTYDAWHARQAVTDSTTGNYYNTSPGTYESYNENSITKGTLSFIGNDVSGMNILSNSTTVDNGISLAQYIKNLLIQWHVVTGVHSSSTYVPEGGGYALGGVSVDYLTDE